MDIEIKYQPSYALAVVRLQPGEAIRAEGGSMVTMHPNLDVETSSASGKKKGGLLKGLKRMLAGESFFMNVFTAARGGGEVTLAPKLSGDIFQTFLTNEELIIQGSSYMASHPDVEIDSQFGGMKSFFSGENVFWLKASGTGALLFNSFGGIHKITLANEKFIVDTGHIVAFQSTMTYKIRKAGGWKSFFLSGEGLVCEFEGSGDLYIQTRNAPALGQMIGALLPPRN